MKDQCLTTMDWTPMGILVIPIKLLSHHKPTLISDLKITLVKVDLTINLPYEQATQ